MCFIDFYLSDHVQIGVDPEVLQGPHLSTRTPREAWAPGKGLGKWTLFLLDASAPTPNQNSRAGLAQCRVPSPEAREHHGSQPHREAGLCPRLSAKSPAWTSGSWLLAGEKRPGWRTVRAGENVPEPCVRQDCIARGAFSRCCPGTSHQHLSLVSGKQRGETGRDQAQEKHSLFSS